MSKPIAGKVYALTGLGPCIAKGNTWAESEVNRSDVWGRYEVKCDECKQEIRRTNKLSESAAGGRCVQCRQS